MATTATRSGNVGGALRLFSDSTRLRMLAVLEVAELSVGELSRTLDLSQSRVSNHLRILRASGLLLERRVGTSTYLRLERPGGKAAAPEGVAARVWSVLRTELDELPEHGADRIRLEAVLAARLGDDALFDRMAGEWDKLAGAFTTGRARERAALHLMPPDFVVADLGCGTGYMAEALLESAGRVICVDRSDAMLDEARKRLSRRAPRARIEFRRGRLDALPIEDQELDGLVVGMVLHHLDELDPAILEMRRVLKPGGTAAVLELAPHHETWMRAELGDRHLGVPATDILAAFERAGFEDPLLDPVEDHYRPRRSGTDTSGDPVSLSLYIARGRRPL